MSRMTLAEAERQTLLFLTTQLPSSGLKLAAAKTGYHISAAFDNVGDLKVGSPVTMAGVHR